jgi:hypothetical protein
MSDRTDRELVELARRGDRAAMGDLFSRYWRAARAAAFGVTGQFASAEDAAAEAFRHALDGLSSLRDPDRFGSWLRTIVVRKAQLERQRRPAEALSEDLSDPTERPDQAPERLEAAGLIQDLLERLAAAVLPAQPVRCAAYDEPRYRSALQLHPHGWRAGACWPTGRAVRRQSTRRTCGSSWNPGHRFGPARSWNSIVSERYGGPAEAGHYARLPCHIERR